MIEYVRVKMTGSLSQSSRVRNFDRFFARSSGPFYKMLCDGHLGRFVAKPMMTEYVRVKVTGSLSQSSRVRDFGRFFAKSPAE
jgi:hypothetical protein